MGKQYNGPYLLPTAAQATSLPLPITDREVAKCFLEVVGKHLKCYREVAILTRPKTIHQHYFILKQKSEARKANKIV